MPETVMITGAGGFIGAALCRYFAAADHPVVAVYHRHFPQSDCVGATQAVCDLTSQDSVEELFKSQSPDWIVHCAAYGVDNRQQNVEQAIKVNVQGTVSMVTRAAQQGVRRFLHLGSCYEYGASSAPIDEHAPLYPAGLYGSTKAAASLMALERARTLELDLLVARPFGVYGPGEGEHKLFPQLVEACVERQTLELSTGLQVRDYLYIDDLCEALMTLLRQPFFSDKQVFNVGSGTGLTLRSLAGHVAAVCGENEQWFRWGRLEGGDADDRYVASCDRIRSCCGWTPQFSIEAGIEAMVAAYRAKREARCVI